MECYENDDVSIEQEYPIDIYAEEEAQREFDLEAKMSAESEREEISINLGKYPSHGLMLDDKPNGHLNHNWDGLMDHFELQENMEDGIRIASEDAIRFIIMDETLQQKNRWREYNSWLWTTDMQMRVHFSLLRVARRIFNISKA